MKILRKIRGYGESILFCIGLMIVPFLSRRLLIKLASFSGSIAFCLSRKLRNIGISNVNVAFGSSFAQEDKLKIVRESFKTFSLVLMDIFWFARFSEKRILKYVKFDSSFDYYFKNKPLIVVCGHFGNWEIMGQAVSLQGAPCVSVAATLENPVVDRILNRIRMLTGQKIVKKHGAIRNLVKVLRKGERIALVMDQNTLPEDGGVFVNLFDLLVPVSKAPADLSLRSKVSIIFTYCISDKNGYYTAYAVPMKQDSGSNEKDITQLMMNMMEESIRRYPGKWLWMYKRWKYIPSNISSDKYPFYSRFLV